MPREISIDDFGFGFTWVVDEAMHRSSHALLTGDGVWLIEPVDHDDAIAEARALGEIRGVIQLLDRHNRNCADVADRLGVPLQRLPDELEGAPFEFFSVIDRPKWREQGIWWAERKLLVVPEALNVDRNFAVAGTSVGIHPFLRLTPPSAPTRFGDAEHLLTGHGGSLHASDAGEQIATAVSMSRRDIPRLFTRLPSLVKEYRR